jgi:hypothetical protein
LKKMMQVPPAFDPLGLLPEDVLDAADEADNEARLVENIALDFSEPGSDADGRSFLEPDEYFAKRFSDKEREDSNRFFGFDRPENADLLEPIEKERGRDRDRWDSRDRDYWEGRGGQGQGGKIQRRGCGQEVPALQRWQCDRWGMAHRAARSQDGANGACPQQCRREPV